MPIQVPVTQTGLEASIQAAAQKAGRNLKINLGTNTRNIEALVQPLGRITGKADEFTKSMEAANARVLAFGASVGVLNGVIQGFKNLVTTTIEVEKSLASINSILNQSSSELDKFKKQIFDTARNTEQSFATVAEAALELSRQGLAATEVTKRLNDSLILSRLSGLDAANAVSGLTSAINAFNSAGLSSGEILNKISAAAASAAVSERDLIDAIKRSGSVAVTTGVQFDELVGIVSALQEKTSRGGAVIGNSLKTIFTRIQSLENLEALQDLGVQVTDLGGNVLSSNKLIENLAGTFKKLTQTQQINLADKLVGKFQIAPFLALLEDYNEEISRTGEVTQVSFAASDEAYKRNAALNKTLSAIINETVINVKELANALGEIGVTDSLKNIISFFDSVIVKIKEVFEGEGIGSDLAKGLIKGLSAIISGPGLAIFGAIIAKLSIDLVKFGANSLKTFFGLNKAAKEQAQIQGQIASTLLSNRDIQKTILNIENQTLSVEQKRKLQADFFTDAVNTQLAAMRQMQAIAGSIAPAVMAGTARARKGSAAGGFLPVGAERSDIAKGVGGAPKSAKPVVIPNFAFGGGQKGTMVANSSEYIVPNFAGGGDAIFNQNMIASMGLPKGARKINAAGGFIPNFAKASPAELITSIGATSIQDLEKYRQGTSKSFNIGGITLPQSQAENVLKRLGKVYNSNLDPKTIMLVPQTTPYNPSGLRTIFTKPKISNGIQYNSFEGGYAGLDPQLKSGGLKQNSRFIKLSNIDQEMNQALADAANNILTSVQPDIQTIPESLNTKNIGLYLKEGGAGAIGAIRGALFESVINIITKGVKDKNAGTLDVSFDAGNNRGALEEMFGLEGQNVKYADFKNSVGQKDKFIDQVMRNIPRSANGYIPNFAAVQRMVGYLDGDVLSDPKYAETVKEQIKKLGLKGGVAEYHKYLGMLASKARANNKLKRFTGIYGVPGAGKSTMMLGGARAAIADNAKARTTKRIPIIKPEDISKVSEVIDTRASLVGTARALEGGYLSNVDRMMVMSSSTPEEQAEIIRRRNLRDSQIKAGTSSTAFGRTAGTSQGAMVDSGYIEAMALSILGPSKTRIMGIKSNFGLYKKKGDQLPLVESRKIGLAYGAFSPSTKGHAEMMKMAASMGISAEDFIVAVSREGGTINPKDPHSWRTALYPQSFRKILAQKTFAGANVIGADPNLFQGGIPSMLELDPSNGRRRFIKAAKGSRAFVGSDKTEKDLEKYIQAGYQVEMGERTAGISGTSAREAIDASDSKTIAKLFASDTAKIINQYLPQLKNRSDIFPQIIQRASDKLDKRSAPIEAALAKLPGRITDKVDPTIAEQILALRESRDKIKKLKQKYPNIMLRKLGAMFPSKYGLPSAAEGYIPNFALSANALQSLKLRAAYQGSDPRLIAEANNAKRILQKKYGFTQKGQPISLRQLFDRDAIFNSKGLTDMVNYAYRLNPTGSEDAIFATFQKLAQREPNLTNLRTMVQKKGYIPNFAMGALSEAIEREKAAGIPGSQIYVDQNASLKNPMNPMGLMVANRRDEPVGGIQGIARAKKEGANPMLYGAANGYIPNYAEKPAKTPTDVMGQIFLLQTIMSGITGAFSDTENSIGKFMAAVSQASLALVSLASIRSLASGSGAATGVSTMTSLGQSFAYGRDRQSAAGQKNLINKYGSASNADRAGVFLGATRSGRAAMSVGAFLGKNAPSSLRVFSSFGGAIAKVLPFLGRMVPALGQLLFAFQAINAITGGALGKKLKEYMTNIGEALNLVDTPAEKAAKALDKLTDAAYENAIAQGFSKNALEEFFKNVSEADTEKIKKQLSEKGKKRVENDENAQKVLLEETIQKATFLDPALQKKLYDPSRIYTVSKGNKEKATPRQREKYLQSLISGEAGPAGLMGQIGPLKAKQLSGLTFAMTSQFANKEDEKELFKLLKEGEKDQAVKKTQQIIGGLDREAAEFYIKIQEKIINGSLTNKQVEEEINKFTETRTKLAQKEAAAEEYINQITTRQAQAEIQHVINLKQQQLAAKTEEEKSLEIAKIRGTLTEKQIRDQQLLVDLRRMDLDFASQTIDNIAEELKAMEGIVQDEKQIQEIRKELGKLSAEDLMNQTEIERVLQKSLESLGQTPKQAEKLAQRLGQSHANAKVLYEKNRESEKSLRESANNALDLGDNLQKAIRSAELLQNRLKLKIDVDAEAAQANLNQLIRNIDLQLSGNLTEEKRLELEAERSALQVEYYNDPRVARQRSFENIKQAKSAALQMVDDLKDQYGEEELLIMKQNIQEGEMYGLPEEISTTYFETLRILESQQNNELANLELTKKINNQKATQYGLLDVLIQNLKNQIQESRKSAMAQAKFDQEMLQSAGFEKEARLRGKEFDYIKKYPGLPPELAVRRGMAERNAFERFTEETSKDPLMISDEFHENLKNAAVDFKTNITEGMMDALKNGKSLGDVLKSAGLSFLETMNRALMQRSVDTLLNAIPFFGGGGGSIATGASGGKVSGGSGVRDDVPALLMGGEYIIRKNAVSKYGVNFFEGLNNGTVPKFAKGGFFAPGLYGQGAISGKKDLLSFATQSYTSGSKDYISSIKGGGAISLEPESVRLTTLGRNMGTPMQRATEEAKGQAFDLYLQQMEQEKQLREAEKARKKELQKQLISMAIMAAASVGITAAISGASAEFGASKAAGGSMMKNIGAGFKGMFTGGDIGGINVGGLKNLFSGAGKMFTGNLSEGSNLIKLSQIGSLKGLNNLYDNDSSFASFLEGGGGLSDKSMALSGSDKGGGFLSNLRSLSKSPFSALGKIGRGINLGGISSDTANAFDDLPYFNADGSVLPPKDWEKYATGGYATGGRIPAKAGIDMVPAMLSGGEFIMNSAATQNIGAGNLNALNSGASSVVTEEKSEELNDKIINKLDELIETFSANQSSSINITVNKDGKTEQSSENASDNERKLGERIKQAVIRIIEEEKRLGGTLRRGLA